MSDANNLLRSLKPKDKEPNSVSTLTKWIDSAERQLEVDIPGRLAWLVSTSVAVAKLQQVVDSSSVPRFVLKGGTLLQYRLGLIARATKDIDGIVRGDIDSFLRSLDIMLRTPWGPISFRRSEIEEINVPNKMVNPRRFHLSLTLRGKTWRRIQIEISPDEGTAGRTIEAFEPPSLSSFGIPTPDMLIGLHLSYQIAQKIHASSDPHAPPEHVNDRARDLVDLILLQKLVADTGQPSKTEIRSALQDIFESRAIEIRKTGGVERNLPAQIVAYPDWSRDYAKAAQSTGVALHMDQAATQVNTWIIDILSP
ncbi:MAG: nucleotidyl transferase AbiEii/AbiGii toxin family protein [Actinomycetaceae bacterium]|nr:nucleotidyl transferase AbiEii/AbiGii toxin family protein [Actinomycetaceae bacterium]